MQKGVEAVRMARKAGVEPNGFFLMGLSGDTEQTMRQTIDYARKLKLDVAKCGITVPFPGTPMFDRLHSAGAIRSYDWDRYNLYQSAESLFDHPNLDWPVICEYVRKFYSELYFRDPSYLWRRLRFMVRNMEVLWNVYYAIKFWMVRRRKPTLPSTENYAYRDLWRKLDINGDDIHSYARAVRPRP